MSILILSSDKRQVKNVPSSNAGSSVKKQFKIKISNSRIEFGTENEIVNSRTTKFNVKRVSGCDEGLQDVSGS